MTWEAFHHRGEVLHTVTADQMPGVRAILDRCSGHPSDEAMAHVMAVSTAKERQMLAVLAGRVSRTDVEPHGQRIGE